MLTQQALVDAYVQKVQDKKNDIVTAGEQQVKDRYVPWYREDNVTVWLSIPLCLKLQLLFIHEQKLKTYTRWLTFYGRCLKWMQQKQVISI